MPVRPTGCPGGGGGGAGLILGPATNTFTGTDETAAESARDTYATANTSWLTQYNDNPNYVIVVTYGTTTVYQARRGTAWADVTPLLRGPPGIQGPAATVVSDATLAGAGTTADPLIVANPFTVADETKLDGIETAATADQTGAEMVTALSGLSGTARLPATAVRDLPSGGSGAGTTNLGQGDIASDGTLALDGTTDPPEGGLVRLTVGTIDAGANTNVALTHNSNTYSFQKSGTGSVKAGDLESDTAYIGYIASSNTVQLFTAAPLAQSDEDVRDLVAAQLTAGTNISLTEDDAANTITIAATGSAAGEENVQADWDETDTASDAYIQNKPTISTGTGLTDEQAHELALVPGLEEKTHDLESRVVRTWEDATGGIAFAVVESEPDNVSDLSSVTFTTDGGPLDVAVTGDSDRWIVFRDPESGVDRRDYRLRISPPGSSPTILYLPILGELFVADGSNHYLKHPFNFSDGSTELQMEVDEVTSSTHYRGESDAGQVQLDRTDLNDRLGPSSITTVQDAIDTLDKWEVEDITSDGLPTPGADQRGKVFVDAVNKTASFLTQELIHGTAPSGTFSAFSNASWLGGHAHDPDSQVTDDSADIGKFYWNWNRHIFREWEFSNSAQAYHWVDVHNPATFLANHESFAGGHVWAGYAATDAELLLQVPSIGTGGRAYGVRLNSNADEDDGVIGIRFINAADFTAGTSDHTNYGYATMSVAGSSGATVHALNTEINSLRNELLGSSPPDSLNTLAELATAIQARTDENVRDVIVAMLTAGTNITLTENDGANTLTIASSGGGGGATLTDANIAVNAPSGESTTVGASRQAIAEAIAGASVGSTTPPTQLYSNATGITLTYSSADGGSTPAGTITTTVDPDTFEVLLFDVGTTGSTDVNDAPRQLVAALRSSAQWPTTETDGRGFVFSDQGTNTAEMAVWSTGATNLSFAVRHGLQQNNTVQIRGVWGYASLNDYLGPVLPAEVTEAEAEAGTETGTRLFTPQRVAQAIGARITDTDIADDSSTESATVAASRRAVADAVQTTSEQVDDLEQQDVYRTLLLFTRAASEPSHPTVIWTNSGWSPTPNGPWYETEAAAGQAQGTTDPLWMALAHTTRTSNVWHQTAWSVVPLDLPTQYSEDASSWHATQGDDDVWLRYRVASGSWSAPIPLTSRATHQWSEIGQFNLNNGSLNDIDITPIDLSQYAELMVQTKRFDTWPNYSNNIFLWTREQIISLDRVRVAAADATATQILVQTEQPIGVRTSSDESMIGIGNVAVSGNTTTQLSYSFGFRGTGSTASSIQVCQKGANWMWCYVKLFVR